MYQGIYCLNRSVQAIVVEQEEGRYVGRKGLAGVRGGACVWGGEVCGE